MGDYAGVVGQLVRRAKFSEDDAAAEGLVSAFVEGMHRVIPLVDGVVPVGTTPWRRLSRGMHLPDLLAGAFAARRGIRVVPALHRRWSSPQSRLARSDRAVHAATAFKSSGAVPATVLLVDDVLTSGATAHAAAAELLGNGAERVYLAVLASSGHPVRLAVGIS
jgi:predicted amidophosphoribosyltransferase